MNIRQLLDEQLTQGLHQLGAPTTVSALVKTSTRPEFGDFQANGVMAAAKQLKMNPRELASRLIETVDLSHYADKVEVAGPGFINIHLKNDYLVSQAQQLLTASSVTDSLPKQKIVVDYSSPNLAKEMHVGHLRSTIIGDALARVLEHLGHEVIRQNHVGDWGTQFGMLIAHLKELQNAGAELSMELADLEGFYRAAKVRFDTEPAFNELARNYVVRLQSGDEECLALWRQFIELSLHHSEVLYERLGVGLKREHVMAESAYNPELPKVIEHLAQQGLLVQSAGAQTVFLDGFKNKEGEPLPIIVQKADGGYLYATTDLAAIEYRSKVLQADRVLYLVDARQSLHFQQIFALARLAGFVRSETSLEHMPFGTMLGSDGKPFKTRSGDTVKLADLLDEAQERALVIVQEKSTDLSLDEQQQVARAVGIGAVKYADLAKNRLSDYVFDWNTMLSLQGNTAPYLQYSYARSRSILRKADAIDPHATLLITEPAERALAVRILQFSDVLDSVAREGLPNYLCQYLYEFAGNIMSFYEACPILKEGVDPAVRQSRLLWTQLGSDTIRVGLSLLGIQVLERM
ncbi:MAG: arginine--tRNA ligase [Thiofilum sp.]|uniref:arginine--tRNA ligase n=1 Tax=Thiofilum sp. TaxID=2212733 RepID=UPI0025FF561B|nr:arginine--tRNA ligase [Thiofilum sp.]MBK8452993.1 arginine--tRNA ligase [Thiofilum sp.]